MVKTIEIETTKNNGDIMANEKFTPGPWDVDKGCEQNQIHDINCNFIACTYSGHFTAEQNTINAHLIATAPEMYEKLKGIQEWLEWLLESSIEEDVTRGVDFREAINEIDQLLKKARGES